MKKLPRILVYAVIIILCVIYASMEKESVDFSSYPAGKERKEAFVGYFLPIIHQENKDILKLRERLNIVSKSNDLSGSEQRWLAGMAKTYKIKPDDPALISKLLTRVDIIPPSLAIAQGANESAWGTSRFATQGNNYFGEWCFKAGCGIVPKQRTKGATHEVRVFDSASESVAGYIQNLNSNNAYRDLRSIRTDLRQDGKEITGPRLADGLLKYSERGQEYVGDLKAMIRKNQLAQLDTVSK